MGNYVLHYDFQAQDMDNVDIVLGYPWMDSVGIVNLNVQKKFLKLWYKKKKITLQNIFLSKSTEPKGVDDVVSTRTWEVTPIHTLDDESMITYTTYGIEAHEQLLKMGLVMENNPRPKTCNKKHLQLKYLPMTTHTTQWDNTHSENKMVGNNNLMDQDEST